MNIHHVNRTYFAQQIDPIQAMLMIAPMQVWMMMIAPIQAMMISPSGGQPQRYGLPRLSPPSMGPGLARPGGAVRVSAVLDCNGVPKHEVGHYDKL